MRDTTLILHFIGLAMGVGSGLGFLFLSIASGKMEPARQRQYMLGMFPLARMGQWGLVLLVLTGGYLMTPFWTMLGDMPLLMAKLVLVLVLGAVVGINFSLARKARKGDSSIPMERMSVLGRIALITSLAIVVVAVLVFH